MASKYAAFVSRGSRWSGPKVHAYRRSDHTNALGFYEAMCGTTDGVGTVKQFKESFEGDLGEPCKKCLVQLRQVGWEKP